MKHLEGLIPFRPFQSLSGKGRSDSATGEEARTGQLTTKPKFLLKMRLQMLEVCKLASFMTTESEQLREQYDD